MELSLALHFFALNRERAQIAFASFSDHVNEVIDFSQGNSAVRDMLQQLANDRDYVKTHVKGRTALWDAVFRGVQLLDHPTFADAVYVLTDGGDNASHHKAGDLLRYLDVTSVRLFAVLLYQRSGYRNRTPEESYGSSDLAEIAGKTGGEILTAAERKGDRVALSADAAAKLKAEETLSRLYQAILQDNMLEIELPFPIAKNERFELKVSGTSRGKWKGIQITYPTTLLSCNAEVSGTGRR